MSQLSKVQATVKAVAPPITIEMLPHQHDPHNVRVKVRAGAEPSASERTILLTFKNGAWTIRE